MARQKEDMNILIVDDSHTSRTLIRTYLSKSGYKQIKVVSSAQEVFDLLGLSNDEVATTDIDVILMDVIMEGMDGIEASRIIRAKKRFSDIPIIMVTAVDNSLSLDRAFEAGASDYIKKPVDKIELLARVRSALSLKMETDTRKSREKELVMLAQRLDEANKELLRLSALDGLTGIANRRHLDDTLNKEWRRALRDKDSLALAMIDVDHFKLFNDHYGHQAGDSCLKKVAIMVQEAGRRPADLAARYGGEEFALLLPGEKIKGAVEIVQRLRKDVEWMKIPHEASLSSDIVTISGGVAVATPTNNDQDHIEQLIGRADKALYIAKENGRNRIESVE